LVLLTRLSPAFPFMPANSSMASRGSLRDYVIGLHRESSAAVLFAGLGELAGDVARFGEVLSRRGDSPTLLACACLGF